MTSYFLKIRSLLFPPRRTPHSFPDISAALTCLPYSRACLRAICKASSCSVRFVSHIPPFSPALHFLLPSLLLLFFLPLIPAASATLFPSCCLPAHSSSSVSCSQAERSALRKSQEMPHTRHQSKRPGPTKASSISVVTWDKRHYRRT